MLEWTGPQAVGMERPRVDRALLGPLGLDLGRGTGPGLSRTHPPPRGRAWEADSGGREASGEQGGPINGGGRGTKEGGGVPPSITTTTWEARGKPILGPSPDRESEPGGREREGGGAASTELVTFERITSGSVKRKHRGGFSTSAPLAFGAVSLCVGTVPHAVGHVAAALVSGHRMSAALPHPWWPACLQIQPGVPGDKTTPADSPWHKVQSRHSFAQRTGHTVRGHSLLGVKCPAWPCGCQG